MIVYTLPPKSSRLFTCAGLLTSDVNGRNYVIDGNFKMFDARAGSIYLISAVSFSASVPQDVFVGAISDINNFPTINFTNKIGETLTGESRKMVSYSSDAPVDQWYSSDSNTEVFCTLQGMMLQSAEMVAMNNVSFAITFTVYEISSNALSGAFRSGIAAEAQNIFRGHL